ncbi:MAG: PAS domain-containing protein [Bacteroidia bacterium]|nr:PAS domain-containing protein [Bacteroidia bacterium]
MKNIEEELKEKEYLLNEAQKIAKLGSYSLDIATGIWNSSEILDDIFGIDKNYVRSIDGWANIVHPDHRKMMTDYFTNDVLAKKGSFNKEYKIIKQNNGKILWVHGLGELRFDSKGNVIKMLGTITDITERKLIELLLKEKTEEIESQNEEYKQLNEELNIIKLDTEENEARLKEAQRIAHIGHWVLDLENNVLHWSDEVYRIFNLKPQEFAATYEAFINAIHPDDRIKVNIAYTSSLETKSPYEIIHRLLMSDGKVKHVKERCETFYNKEEKPYRSVGTIQDITEQIIYEEELKQKNEEIEKQNEEYKQLIEELQLAKDKIELSENKFRNLVETSSDIIWETNIDGVYTYISPQVENILGFKQSELIGKSPFYIMPQDDAKRISIISDNIVKSKQPFSGLETPAIDKNGNLFTFETNGVPVFDSKRNIIGYRGINRNITKRKQAEKLLAQKNDEIEAQNEEYKQLNEELNCAKEKAEESDRLKSAFLANMSHEIRTPMNGIIGFSQLLLKKNLPEDKKQKFVEIINTNGYQLLGIINDIIDISKIELGIVTPYFSNISLDNILEDIETMIKPSANSKNIRLSLNKSTTSSVKDIYTDDIKLRQILTNLLTNAVKFTNKGTIEFGYEIKSDKIEFYVKDEGCGIPEDKINLIFERFRQLDNQPDDSRTGTGLGLAITKAFVGLLGGEIWLKSELNKGTTFYFTIKYQPSKSELVSDFNTKEEHFNWYNKTILVAEDDLSNFKLIEEIFAATNAKIIYASNGQKAIDEFNNNEHIDIILMDIKLPVKNGYVATAEIRKINKTVPIIAITAYAFSEDKEKAMLAGCSDYLSKPINDKELCKLINKYFEP